MSDGSTLAQRLGAEQAARLSALVGGTQVVIPNDLTDSKFRAGHLRGKVGDTLFALLVFHFGGTRVYVPQVIDRQTGRNKGVTVARVMRLTARNWSAARIAQHLGCSERTIYHKRATAKRKGK